MKQHHFIQLAAIGILSVFFSFNVDGKTKPKLKISLNAFSFNKPLLAGEMTIDDVLDFAAETGFEGVDLTGYYFPGYPSVPSDEYIYHVKKRAFKLGLEICGSGVKNDFTYPDPEKRAAEKKLVKDWIDVTSKLGGQTLRIFTGKKIPEGYTWEQTAEWVAADIHECAEYAREHGVMLAIQNHNDFLKTAGQIQTLLKKVNSDWVGLMLDIGCFHSADPFAEIEQNVPLAITWQIKEEMYINDQPVKTNLDKLKKIIDASTYRGYLPIETLGEGNPQEKITFMYKEIKKRFE